MKNPVLDASQRPAVDACGRRAGAGSRVVMCGRVLLRMQLLGVVSELVVIGWAGVHNGVAFGLC